MKFLIIILFFLLIQLDTVLSIGFLYPIVVGTGSALYASWGYLKCFTYECCNEQQDVVSKRNWIMYNEESLAKLKVDLKTRLYGQPLAADIIHKAVKTHVMDPDPPKPLVMSFHGWTGSGKTHVSQIIANNLYKKGIKSEFVHFIASPYHFPERDSTHLPIYKAVLKQMVDDGVKKCGRSLFIFDEIDKMPHGLIDTLNPYLDYNIVGGNDFRRSIFVFLSNTGGTEIVKLTHDFWKRGKERKEIQMKDVEKLIQAGAFNEKGGFHKSEFIGKNLVDFYVPFLPLEKKHIKSCIRDYVQLRYNTTVDDEFLERVSNELEYDPPDTQIYSKTGCKRIPKKVDVHIVD